MSAVDTLQDGEVVALVRHLSEELAQATTDSPEPVLTALRADEPEFGDFVDWAMPLSRQEMGRNESVEVARALLKALERHPDLGPIIEAKAEDFSDKRMSAELILSLGAAASMIFLAVSSRVRISYDKDKGFNVELGIDPIETERIHAVMKPLSDVATSIQGIFKKPAD